MHSHLASASAARGRVANVALALIAAIAIVFLLQYGMGVAPCHLCLGERVPYYVAIPLCMALAAVGGRMPPALLAAGLAALCGVLAWSFGLGVDHVGVEHGWWAGPSSCTHLGGPGDARTLLEQLRTVNVVPCDKVRWRFAGLSLAELNAGLCGVLLAYAAHALSGYVGDLRSERTVRGIAAA